MRRAFLVPLICTLAVTAMSCRPGDRPNGPPVDPGPRVSDAIDAVPLTDDPTPTPPTAAAPKPAMERTAPAPDQPSAEPDEPQAQIPEGPDRAPRRVPVSETPCREAIGDAAAARLVQRCLQVSPATRPPCNAANACDVIQSEIDRSCALWRRDGDAPAQCGA